jgi:hypothetical protein
LKIEIEPDALKVILNVLTSERSKAASASMGGYVAELDNSIKALIDSAEQAAPKKVKLMEKEV